jgi:hypothetical protein
MKIQAAAGKALFTTKNGRWKRIARKAGARAMEWGLPGAAESMGTGRKSTSR